LTNWIGVTKYEPVDTRINIGGFRAGLFPAFIVKTDQTRIQNCIDYFTKYADVEFEVSEKLEGSSITTFYKDGDFGICSRNYRLKEIDNNQSIAVKTVIGLGLREKLTAFNKNIALQGELIGPDIQGNIYKLKQPEYRIFDIYLINENRYATPDERQKILETMGIVALSVPILERRKLAGFTITDILAYSDGKSVLFKTQLREGLVWKSILLIEDNVLSFKSISNAYLLKQA